MTKVEKKIADFVMNHLNVIAIVAVTLIGVIIRIPLRGFLSDDADIFLLPWYEEIQASGISKQVGNYNLVYQFAIYVMTKLPIKPLYAYKILSCIFDLLLAVVCALVVDSFFREEKRYRTVLVYGAVLISPVVLLNSAAWAQCDSIYVFFGICGLYLLLKDRPGWAMFCFGLSLAFKLQAVFFFPALFFIYLMKKNFTALKFLLIPAGVVGCSLPMLMAGRTIREIVLVYFWQTKENPMMHINYPSLYCLLDYVPYEGFSEAAILITVVALGMLFFYIAHQNKRVGGGGKADIIIYLFLSTYTCVLLLPAMHERYGYSYEILAWILACLIPKTAPLCIGLQLMTLRTYSHFLFKTPINLTALGYLNIVIYFLYVWILLRELKQERR